MRPKMAGYIAGALLAAAASGCASLPRVVQNFDNLASSYFSVSQSPCTTRYGILTSVSPPDELNKFELRIDNEQSSLMIEQQNDNFKGIRIAPHLTLTREIYYDKGKGGWRNTYAYRGPPFEADLAGVFSYALPHYNEKRRSDKPTRKDRKEFKKEIKIFSKALAECKEGR